MGKYVMDFFFWANEYLNIFVAFKFSEYLFIGIYIFYYLLKGIYIFFHIPIFAM